MRILFIVPGLSPSAAGGGTGRTGIEDYTVCLCRQLAEAGEEVDVLCGASAWEPIPSVTILSRIRRWNITAIGPILRTVRERNPDVINWQYNPFMYGRWGLAPAMACLALLLRLASRKRVVVTLHELFFPLSELGVSVRGFVWCVVQLLELFHVGLGGHVLVATTGQRTRFLQRLFPWKRSRIYRIPVGSTILPSPLTAEQRLQLRQQLGIRDKAVLLGTFSVLASQSSILAVVDALALLAHARDAYLLIPGTFDREGPTWKAALALAERCGVRDRILTTGPIPKSEVSRYFQLFDVYLALYHDGVSGGRTSLTVALAHGVPVVSTRGPGTEGDWFGDGESVTLLDRVDGPTVARAVEAIVEDARLAHRLGVGARARFEASFTWPVIARLQLDVMRRALNTVARRSYQQESLCEPASLERDGRRR